MPKANAKAVIEANYNHDRWFDPEWDPWWKLALLLKRHIRDMVTVEGLNWSGPIYAAVHERYGELVRNMLMSWANGVSWWNEKPDALQIADWLQSVASRPDSIYHAMATPEFEAWLGQEVGRARVSASLGESKAVIEAGYWADPEWTRCWSLALRLKEHIRSMVITDEGKSFKLSFQVMPLVKERYGEPLANVIIRWSMSVNDGNDQPDSSVIADQMHSISRAQVGHEAGPYYALQTQEFVDWFGQEVGRSKVSSALGDE